MMTLFYLSVEIELPDDVSDEYQDAMVDDLSYDPHIERLERLIKKWVRLVTGESCHISVKIAD